MSGKTPSRRRLGCVAAGPEKVRAIRECPKPSYKARSFYGLPTFIIAECVLIYLDPDSSRAIVAWASKTFSTGIFFLYEQVLQLSNLK
ncbi:hypothetical protein RJ639_042879 [Escallonia herrerae]|uniref:[Phosphatase 2A protein]-leucine-carboxy methyltransferase 1 n=1 Tax=Escallonia herrerae TaxID=1293975 RepID=A0AA89B9A7_9ASTE|nr:hypothetical protein RJ639_042879 [Escallonia herrerae]